MELKVVNKFINRAFSGLSRLNRLYVAITLALLLFVAVPVLAYKITKVPKAITEPNTPSEVKNEQPGEQPVTNKPSEQSQQQMNDPRDAAIKKPMATSSSAPAELPPELDETSKAAFYKKLELHLAISGNFSSFLDNSTPYSDTQTPPNQRTYAINYLDTADANINASKGQDYRIKTPGTLSKEVLSLCQQADQAFANTVLGYRGWAYYELIGDTAKAASAYGVAWNEHPKALNYSQQCTNKLQAIY